MKKEISLEETKSIQLNILNFVSDYCRDNKLHYFLAYGTLLGAIRHKGYIPWDDDIDIVMPRPDYEYLLHNFKDINSRYMIKHYTNDKDFTAPFIKIYDNHTQLIESGFKTYKIGVNIDVFPLDGLPNDMNLAKKHLKKLQFLYRLIEGSKIFGISPKNSWHKNLLIYILRFSLYFVKPKSINRNIDKLSSQFDYDTSKNVAVCMAGYGINEIMKKEIFLSETLRDFESKSYVVPQQYHEYLKTIFGDYMELPPIEQRVSRHSFKAYLI